jgi:ribonuclease BN (tRNA processing enzyme)
MDHVQGLPFYPPLLDPDIEVHVWGPVSTTRTLRERISRYLSPPLFPIRVRELANVIFHDVVPGQFEIGPLHVKADLISHPGSTLGYRITEGDKVLTYMPDHEPALGNDDFPGESYWTSGFELAENADILIHDTQYEDDEYTTRVGWGHTSVSQLADFARMTSVSTLVTFHHDPAHDDPALDELHDHLRSKLDGVSLVPGTAGLTLDV